MNWHERFIAVDWGTTNRRAYAIAGTTVIDSFEDDQGILAVRAGGFAESAKAIAQRLGSHNILFAGMVGSNRGWADAGYVRAPARLSDIARAVHWVSRDVVGIVPGVRLETSDRFDVMRGEEVQAFGAVVAELVKPDALVCHPGTHTKWIELAEKRITDFATAMTGEVYALLVKHSVLAVHTASEIGPDDAFFAGVDLAQIRRPLLDAVFEVRSRGLAGVLDDRDAASFLSGILIGSDVVAHTLQGDREVALIGRPDLCTLYAAALEHSGRKARSIDGAAAFVAGMIAIRDCLI